MLQWSLVKQHLKISRPWGHFLSLHVTNRGAPVSLSYIIVVKYELTSHVRRMVFITEIKEYFQLTVFFPQRCNVAKNIHRYISLLLGQTTKI